MLRTNYKYVEQSAQIANHPTLVYSISFVTSSAGVGVILYDAPDANTAQIALHLHELSDRHVTENFNPPIIMQKGLYLTLESGCDSATIQYCADWQD